MPDDTTATTQILKNTEIVSVTTLVLCTITIIVLVSYILCDCWMKRRQRDVSYEALVTERTYLSTGRQGVMHELATTKTTTLNTLTSNDVMMASRPHNINNSTDKLSLDSGQSVGRSGPNQEYWPWLHHTEPLADEVNFSKQKSGTSSCNKILATIAALETTCNVVSGDFDRCASGVKDVALTASDDLAADVTAVSFMQADQQALTRHWGGVRRLLYCADVHLRNAALYQKFYVDLKHLQRLIETARDSQTMDMVKERIKLQTPNDLDTLISSTKSWLETLKTWESMQRHLSERSVTLVPVALRTQPLGRRVPLRALCAYTSDTIQLAEGETVTLISNYNVTVWRVRTGAGVEGDVPAVCLLIPPPDNDAIEAAARLHRHLLDTFDVTRMLAEKRVIKVTRSLFADMAQMGKQMSVMTAEHKQQLLSRVDYLESVLHARCSRYDLYPEIVEHIDTIRQMAEVSLQRGAEDKDLERDVLNVTEQLKSLFDDYELLSRRYETLRSIFDGVLLKSVPDTASDDSRSNASVTVVDGSNKDAERHSTDERRRKLAIQAVKDPDTDEELPLDVAVARGIIDPEANAYVNRKTGERYPIPVATAAGFILVSEVPDEDEEETARPVTTVEIVGISMRHDTRPYKVRKVRELATDRWIGVADAVKDGWLRPQARVYCDVATGDEMSQDAALDLGLLQVKFPEGTVPSVTRVVRYFAMYGLYDSANNMRLMSYNEAFERGLLDRGDGTVQDTLTGRWTTIPEALLHRWVRAAVVEDVDSFDSQLFLTNHSIAD